MARYLPATRPPQADIPTPLTLTALQTYVGGFIKFVDLPSGDVLVVNEASQEFHIHNPTASAIAGSAGPIFGDAVICSPSEIA